MANSDSDENSKEAHEKLEHAREELHAGLGMTATNVSYT